MSMNLILYVKTKRALIFLMQSKKNIVLHFRKKKKKKKNIVPFPNVPLSKIAQLDLNFEKKISKFWLKYVF